MKQVLIVDDNRDLAANIAEILEDAGHRALVASDGREALAVIQREHLDAVLTDMRMPRMSGPELLREIRRVKPELPVMAFTAWSGSSELAQAGLLAVLPKPVPLQRLVNLLDAARPSGVVLVVEDDEVLRESVTELLREAGMSVIAVATAAAIDGLGAVQPFAALVDLRLPDAPSGESLLRVQRRFPGVPLVPISGSPELAAAAGGALPKPFDPAALLARLDALYRARTRA
jgi:two-component system, response regulator PdtaR